MTRIPQRILEQANQFLLEIHGTTNARELRACIPAGISRLIACDRASFNEIDFACERRKIVPTPVPSWWARLGDVYQAHLTDHPLWNQEHLTTLGRTISLHDRRFAATWKKSALNHEYFKPLGFRHQISNLVHRQGNVFIGIAVNRSGSDFRAQDRALLDLVGPHVSQAWKNALALARLGEPAAPDRPTRFFDQAVIAVDRNRSTMRPLSRQAAAMMREYFAADASGIHRLPDDLLRWLRAQISRLDSPAGGVGPPSAPLITRRGRGRLTTRLAQTRPDEVLLLLEEERRPPASESSATHKLTAREAEILTWITEGKRNAEIALILGVSLRTVEKHVEHVLAKLGVENRTAAIREHLESRRTVDA